MGGTLHPSQPLMHISGQVLQVDTESTSPVENCIFYHLFRATNPTGREPCSIPVSLQAYKSVPSSQFHIFQVGGHCNITPDVKA